MLTSLLVCLLAINGYGQNVAERAFLHNFFGQFARIVYMDKLRESELEQISNVLAQDTLRPLLSPKPGETNDQLVLTQEERGYIQNEWKLQAALPWGNQLFPRGKVLTKATVDSVFRDQVHGWTSFQKQYSSRLYSFSKPVFIRDHSLCIFYTGYSCGELCGEGKLTVFKKVNDVWVPWMDLLMWLS